MAGKTRPGSTALDPSELTAWLFANSRELMHVSDADGCFLLVNPAWSQAIGAPEAELVGRPFRDFVHPDDAAELLGEGREAIREGDLRLRLADGDWCWFSASLQRLDDGREIVLLRDAAAAHARAEELNNLRLAQDMLGVSAGVGAWSFEPGEQRAYCSDQLSLMMGLAPGKATTSEEAKAHLPAPHLAKLSRAFSHSVADGKPGQLEYRMRCPRGWRTMRVTYHTEPRAGGVFALRGVTQDITELAAARDAAVRARREAVANAQRLKIALEVAQAGVYEIDHVSKAFWASPELERLAGPSAGAYAEATELKYPRFHPEDLDHVRDSFRALQQGEKRSGEAFEARILDADGNERWVRIFHHLQVARNGRWLKAVGLVHDIDADKRQELDLIRAQQAAYAAADAKAAFLANMSHEIRTPMNGIIGVMHLLGSEALTAEGRALLDEALTCGQMLAELLNDVIDFSKIEAGCLELNHEPVDPKALVEGVVRLLRPQAHAKSLFLEFDPDERVGWIRSDPVRLRQALFNLIGNAVKFTDTGGVSIRCTTAAEGRLRFEVQDTGIGIPDGSQARIFDRFDQGDASTTRKFGGSGLGLAITKRLAQMLGGDVGFTSVEGGGSTFWLEVEAEAAAPMVEPEAVDEAVLDGLRVLVVEDNPTNRIIATKLLERLGAAVETAEDGYLGVEAAARGGFDLILMDVQMPGIDGLEAARRIRAMGPPIGETPIVALTANVLQHQRQAYLDAGMDGIVGKPISPAALLIEIARLGGAEAPAPEFAAA